MKTRITFLVCVIFLSLINGLNAQLSENSDPAIPFKSGNSILFGKDIIINDQPAQNQRLVKVCSAFNGWLYAVYSYNNGNMVSLTMMKSEDNGMNWSVILDAPLGFLNNIFTKIDIISNGNDVSNLKVFLGLIYYDTITNLGGALVSRFNGVDGSFEEQILNDPSYTIHDLALASDIIYPAANSNPNSIAVLYAKTYNNNKDSLIFRSSSDGGLSFNTRRVVTGTQYYFNNLALTYGYSLSWNTGRYFAAWEVKSSSNALLGHIYTAHTEPNFNSLFTKPKNLDSLDPSIINKCRHPAIACQVINLNNDSLNLTEIVLFEKYLNGSNSYDIAGYYNLQATTTNHFKELNISANSHNKLQPDVNFNTYDSTFIVTYYDSTTQKLPFILKNYNMANPDSWQVVSTGYNDNSSLAAPFPKVRLNIGQQYGVNVWVSEGTGGKGIAMFDAPYSIYTGISGSITTDNSKLFWVYPNPCSSLTTFHFEIPESDRVCVSLYNLQGQLVKNVVNKRFPSGNNTVTYNISSLSSGTYIYKYQTSVNIVSGRLIIVR